VDLQLLPRGNQENIWGVRTASLVPVSVSRSGRTRSTPYGILETKTSKQEELSARLAIWVATSSRPILTLDDWALHAFSMFDIQWPRSHTIQDSYLIPISLMLRDEVKFKMSRIAREELWFHLTIDGWSVESGIHAFGVTVHYTENWKMVSQTLDILKVTSSETGEAILGMLRSLLSLYQIPEWRVLSVTSDHASNMVKAINLSPWNNIGCCAHMVNLAVGEGLDVIGPQVQRLSQCVKSIRKYDFLEVSQGEKYVTISIAFPLLRELHDQLLPNQHSPISTLANSVKVTIRGAIGRRWMLKRELEKHFIRCAIMLDPRIKSIDEGEVVADEFHRKVLQEMSKLKRPQARDVDESVGEEIAARPLPTKKN